MQPDPLDASDVQLLTEIAFLAAGAGLVAQAVQVFESLATLRPQRAFAYIGLATVHLNGKRADDAVAVLDRGRRLLASPAGVGCDTLPPPAQDPVLAEDRAMLAAFQGVALQLAQRTAESKRALRQALALCDSGAAGQLARRMLGSA